jgi:hypothetical protein
MLFRLIQRLSVLYIFLIKASYANNNTLKIIHNMTKALDGYNLNEDTEFFIYSPLMQNHESNNENVHSNSAFGVESFQSDLQDIFHASSSHYKKQDDNKTFIDYFLAEASNIKANVPKGVHLWPKNSFNNKYDIPISLNNVSEITRSRLYYVLGYLSRGVNLHFRKPLPTDPVIVKVTENEEEGCWANLGRGVGYRSMYINIPPLMCNSIHMVLHEVMHVLGFGHEHERSDANGHYVRELNEVHTTVFQTEFDELSVMSYPESVIGPTTNTKIRDIARGRRSFLSRCDWNLLLQLYPSNRSPPDCIPNYVPDLLVPTPALLEYLDAESAKELCHYQNEFFFDVGFCDTGVNSSYPPLEDELAPVSTSTSFNVKPICILQNVCYDKNNSINISGVNDSSILRRPLENHFVLVHIPKKLCRRLLYRFIKLLYNLPFYSECSRLCSSTTTMDPLIKCFRRQYKIYKQTSIVSEGIQFFP